MAAGRLRAAGRPGDARLRARAPRHAFLWNDATNGVRGDYERLREVQAALLGIPRKPARAARARPNAAKTSGTPAPARVARGRARSSAPWHALRRSPGRNARATATTARPRPIARTPPWIPLGHTSMAADQHDAVHRDRQVVRHVRRQRERVREVVGPVREQHEQRGAPDRADERPEAADHHAGQQRERQLQRERARRRRAASRPRAVRRPARRRGAERERERLPAPDAQPGQRRRDLVVADGAQRAADRRCGSGCRARTARPARRCTRSTPPSAPAGRSRRATRAASAD